MTFSLNVIAVEITWFCTSEKKGGLNYKNGKWDVADFIPYKRMVVKQKKDRLIFPKKHSLGNMLDQSKCRTDYDGWIYCNQFANSFVLNPHNGHATSAKQMGHLMGKPIDSLTVSPWKCESF